MDLNAINEALESAENVTVTLASLSGTRDLTAEVGMTVREFKSLNNLSSAKLVDGQGNILRDTDVISENMSLFVSASKQNG